MGWEGPAPPLPHRPGHLMALVVSLLFTFRPGKRDRLGPAEEPDRLRRRGER